jgi:hypothetical protein
MAQRMQCIFAVFVGGILTRPLVVENFGGLDVASHVYTTYMDAIILTYVSICNTELKG